MSSKRLMQLEMMWGQRKREQWWKMGFEKERGARSQRVLQALVSPSLRFYFSRNRKRMDSSEQRSDMIGPALPGQVSSPPALMIVLHERE